MDLKTKRLIHFCSLMIVFAVACNTNNSHHIHPPGEPKYHIALHLHPGDKYYYNIAGDMESRSDVKEKKIESISHSDLGLVYQALEDSGGNIRLQITYDKLHIRIKTGELEKDITARKSSAAEADPIESLLGNILGSSLFVTLDAKGNVIKIEGGKELSDRIMSTIDAPGADTKKIIRQQMEALVGEKFVRNTLQDAFKLFPDTALYIGDSWDHKMSANDNIKLGSNRTLSLTSIKGNIARVEEKSELSKQEDGTISIMGHDVPADIKGGEKGYYEVDTASGMLLKGESNLSLKGTLQVMNIEVPVKVHSGKKISGKKI